MNIVAESAGQWRSLNLLEGDLTVPSSLFKRGEKIMQRPNKAHTLGSISPATLAQATPPAGGTASDDGDTEPTITPIMFIPEIASDGILMYMMRIDFGPGGAPLSRDLHLGQFDMTVTSGSICYTVGFLEAGTTVTAFQFDPTSTHADCAATPNLPCEPSPYDGVPASCQLVQNDVIFLPAGSSIRQMGDGEHFYENVDIANPATVYLTGYQLDDEGAGCRGGCL
jgi:hypothetical protein